LFVCPGGLHRWMPVLPPLPGPKLGSANAGTTAITQIAAARTVAANLFFIAAEPLLPHPVGGARRIRLLQRPAERFKSLASSSSRFVPLPRLAYANVVFMDSSVKAGRKRTPVAPVENGPPLLSGRRSLCGGSPVRAEAAVSGAIAAVGADFDRLRARPVR
jgi:hypothetical protein